MEKQEQLDLTMKINQHRHDLAISRDKAKTERYDEMVKGHMEYRKSMKDAGQQLQLFTGYLQGGASPMHIFKKTVEKIGDTVNQFDLLNKKMKDLQELQDKMNKDPKEKALASNRDKVVDLEKDIASLKESTGGAEANKGLMDKLSGAKEFFLKHKTGMLIGAASAGILLMVLKKAFDVSPMFQAIKKLLNFGIMLVLRPIGDFFGFIMRPIMVMMLRKFIIPWYKDVYPVMKKLGTWIGNQVVPAVEGAADFLSTGAGKTTAAITTAATTGVIVAAKKGWIPKLTGATGGNVGKNILGTPMGGSTPAKQGAMQKIANVLKSPANIIKNITGGIGKILQPLTKGSGVLNLGKNLPQVIGSATKNLKNMSTGAINAVKGAGKIVNNTVGALGKSMGGLKGVNMGRLVGKVGKGGGLVGLAMVAEGMFASPETLGGIIDEDSPHRLDKGLAWLLSGGKTGLKGFSEDESGKFNTIGYGNELADMMGDESYKHGMVAKLFSGGKTGIGGGAGITRGERGDGVTINIANVSKEIDVQHIGEVVSQELAKQNKKTSRF